MRSYNLYYIHIIVVIVIVPVVLPSYWHTFYVKPVGKIVGLRCTWVRVFTVCTLHGRTLLSLHFSFFLSFCFLFFCFLFSFFFFLFLGGVGGVGWGDRLLNLVLIKDSYNRTFLHYLGRVYVRTAELLIAIYVNRFYFRFVIVLGLVFLDTTTSEKLLKTFFVPRINDFHKAPNFCRIQARMS